MNRDPFRNYDAWLEAPLRIQERMEAAEEQMIERFQESETFHESFREWLFELNPGDLPSDVYTTLVDHWRKTGHYAGVFQAFCEDEMAADEEAAYERMAEERADREPNLVPWEEP